MWQAFVDFIANILVFLNTAIAGVGIPFSFGFAIILFTVLIKVITYPLNKKQMESTRATQDLQPKLKELQKKYANDKEKLSQAQMQLYKEAGVNPLGGCFPMLVQMPIWFALYRAIYGMAGSENAAYSAAIHAPFFWIPSLAGPVTDRAAGLTWLYPFVNGAPPVGWVDAISYLILPILLVVSQLYTQKMMSPQSSDPNQKAMGQAMMLMPLMFGYFALVVPSGLTLYWFTNNILSVAQQWWINRSMDMKNAHAKNDVVKQNGNTAPKSSKLKDTETLPPADPTEAAEAKSNGDGADTGENTQVENNEQYQPKASRPKSKRKRKK